MNNETEENLRRHCVDLWTLAKGVNSNKTWKARDRLAKYLDTIDKSIEADLWYELAHTERNGGLEDVTEKENDTFLQLYNFLKRHDASIEDPDKKASELIEQYTVNEIAMNLYQQYRKLPKGWELYLVAIKRNVLEIIRMEVEDFKRELRRKQLLEDIKNKI